MIISNIFIFLITTCYVATRKAPRLPVLSMKCKVLAWRMLTEDYSEHINVLVLYE